MGVEEPGTCNPLEHLMGRGESPFVDFGVETEKLEYSGLRVRQGNIRGIRDESVIAKELTRTLVNKYRGPLIV